MALILNIETATTVCSVALVRDGNLLSLKQSNEGRTHAEIITLFIQDVLNESKIKSSELDAIAVSKGPGSYTGLRIGVSTAKGLCYALEKPLVAVNTLQSLSLSLSKGEEIKKVLPLGEDLGGAILFCPMIDARRMEVYCAVYDPENKEIKKTSAEIITENSFEDILAKQKLVFFGDGAAKCKVKLDHQPNAIFIDDIFPSAKNMIQLSEAAFRNKQFEDVAYFEPFYLKDFVTIVSKKVV